APGQQTKTIPVVLLKNGVANEPDKTVQITLSSPTNAVLGAQADETFTIHDMDPKPTVAFALVSGSGQEGASLAVATLRLSAPSAQAVTVTYSLGGTATLGSDYTIAGANPTTGTGTVTFQPGQTAQNIPITV